VTPLEAVVARIADLPRPWRVGIDGVTASGDVVIDMTVLTQPRLRRG
jgi:hypothetical protein